MTTKLRAYRHYNNLGVEATTDLHGNLGWMKMNKNFGNILKDLWRDNQGGTTGTGSTDSPPASAAATITESFSDTGSDLDLGEREERICTKNERRRRERI